MRILSLLPIPLLLATSTAFGALPLGAESLESCFQNSAKKWSVPAPLLKAIAKEETDGFHNIPEAEVGEQDHPKIYGIMGLRNDPVLGRSLEEAALLSGQNVNDLIQKPCANIEGAAALLSKELKRNSYNLATTLSHFWNSESPQASADGIQEVSRILKEGSSGRIALAPSPVLSDLLAADFRAETAIDPKLATSRSPQERGETDYNGADWDASSNFTPNDITPRYIVMHTTEGGFNGAVEWLKSRKSGLSAHYVIRKSDGYVKQLVRESDRANHARCWNVEAIGVEMEGYMKDSSSFSRTLLNAAAKLVEDIASRHGIPTDDLHIIGHNFGDTDKIKQTPLQNCNDHGDPGKYFPWQDFLSLFAESTGRNQWGRGNNSAEDPQPQQQQPTAPAECSWWQFWCHH